MTFLRAAMLGALVLAGLLSAVGVPARANEVVNPGFETGALTPWFQIFPPASMDPADWAVTSSDVHSGSFSAADDGNRGLRQDLPAPIPTSNIAEVSFWIRHPNSANAQTAVDLFYSDATSNETLFSTSSTNWELHDVTANLQAGKSLVGLAIFGYSSAMPPDPTFLDDVTIRLVNQCPAAPIGGCLAALSTKGVLNITDSPTPEKDKLVWKWQGTTALADFGDPTTTSDYQLCVYQNGAFAAAATAPADSTCDGDPCWEATTTGFRYNDPEGTPAGVLRATLKASSTRPGKITVSAKGVHLVVPAGPLATPVEVQLSRTGGGPCWSATFSSPKRNDTGGFQGKSD